MFSDDDSETIGVSLSTLKGNVLFVLCYRSPSSSVTNFTHALMGQLLSVYKNCDKICMLRDFTFPNIHWTCDSAQSSSFELQCLECVNDIGLLQLNNTPSNTCGIMLDLVYITISDRFSMWIKLESNFKSDHNI